MEGQIVIPIVMAISIPIALIIAEHINSSIKLKGAKKLLAKYKKAYNKEFYSNRLAKSKEVKKAVSLQELQDMYVDYLIEHYHFENTDPEYLIYRLVEELRERSIIKSDAWNPKDGWTFEVKD